MTILDDWHSLAESAKSLAQSAHVVAQSYKTWVEFVTGTNIVGIVPTINPNSPPNPPNTVSPESSVSGEKR